MKNLRGFGNLGGLALNNFSEKFIASNRLRPIIYFNFFIRFGFVK